MTPECAHHRQLVAQGWRTCLTCGLCWADNPAPVVVTLTLPDATWPALQAWLAQHPEVALRETVLP